MSKLTKEEVSDMIIFTINNDIRKVQSEIERLKNVLLNPDESRTDVIADRIERLYQREKDLQDKLNSVRQEAD